MIGSTFRLDVFAGARTRVVAVRGRLVVGAGADAPDWRAAAASGRVEHVVLDLADVTAIDAGGIGRLLDVRQALVSRGVRLSVAAVAPRVQRVLTLVGLDAVFAAAIVPHTTRRPAVDTTSAAVAVCRCA